MHRTLTAAVVAGLALLAVTACSSTSTTSTSATTQATASSGGGTTTTAKTSDTKKSTGTTKVAAPKVTKPAKVEKIDKSQLPSSAQKVDEFTGLSGDEQDCVDTVIYSTVSEDPTLADDEATLAGVAGGALVACVDRDKLAAGLIALLRQTDAGSTVTPDQESCITNELVVASDEDLATFIGGLIYGEPTIIQAVNEALDQTCGTTLAA